MTAGWRAFIIFAVVSFSGYAVAAYMALPAPTYHWLQFGPEPGGRVLLCTKGPRCYLDTNNDGHYDYAWVTPEMVTAKIAPSGDSSTYEFKMPSDSEERLTRSYDGIPVEVTVEGPIFYRQVGLVREMADSPDEAEELCFGRPLCLRTLVLDSGFNIVRRLRGGTSPTLSVHLGSGERNFPARSLTVVRRSAGQASLVPAGVHPIVDIEFVDADGDRIQSDRLAIAGEAGSTGWLVRFVVPEEAAGGTARFVIRFDDWSQGAVAPVSFEMPIVP
jgi:hypothetical protein